jgi:hypothetical protein
MAKANLTLAEDAKNQSREWLSLKAKNKRRSGLTKLNVDREDRLGKATLGTNRCRYFRDGLLRHLSAAETDVPVLVAKLTKQVLEYSAGACWEYALLAFHDLIERDVAPSAMVALDPDSGGDHVFVVLGDFPDNLDAPLGEWSSNSFICDPWANIACRARDFHNRWQVKMAKWKREGKEVLYKGGWVDPCRDDWVSSIVAHRRRVVQVPLEHLNTCVRMCYPKSRHPEAEAPTSSSRYYCNLL